MSFEQHCIVELMGHNRIAGKVTEQEIGGVAFLRVDVPEIENIPAFTKFFSAGAVYALTPVDEETCQLAVRSFREKPIEEWRIKIALPAKISDTEYEPDEYDGDDWEDESSRIPF